MSTNSTIPDAEALNLATLVSVTEKGIASRVIQKTSGGTVTLFAFDAKEELSEHSAPFDALVFVLEGEILLTIAGKSVPATPGTVVRMPADIPHALRAEEASKMMLVMLREPSS